MGVENFTRVVGQKDPIEFELMARVRTLFDPQGLFNPGKMIDTQAHLPRAAE